MKAEILEKRRIAVSIACKLVGLPPGVWPETQQCERDLLEALPRSLSRLRAIELAVHMGAKIHPDRKVK